MRRYIAEGIGTFTVVFVGCGATLLSGEKLGLLGIALSFGLSLAVMHLALAPLSGGHCNPALSFSAWTAGRLSGRDVLPYTAAQLGGGALGAALSLYIAGNRPGGTPQAAMILANGYDRLSPGYYGIGAAFLTEMMLTAILVFVFLGATRARELEGAQTQREGRVIVPKSITGGISALALGGAYALIHLVGYSVTKMGANPARSLGSALLSGGMALEQAWLFLAAPMLGALLAGLAHRGLFGTGEPAAKNPKSAAAESAAI